MTYVESNYNEEIIIIKHIAQTQVKKNNTMK